MTEEDYQKEKKRLLAEEKQVKENIGVDGLASWTRTMEEALVFAANVTKIFKEGSPEVKQMTLRILGSNLILKDKKVLITAKNTFSFFKKAEKVMNGEIQWLEPKKDPITGDYLIYSATDSGLERETGIEPATFSLATRRSTTELLPQCTPQDYSRSIRANSAFFVLPGPCDKDSRNSIVK